MTTDISVGVRWDPIGNQDVIEDYEFEYEGGNSSSRLFERSRIKALATSITLANQKLNALRHRTRILPRGSCGPWPHSREPHVPHRQRHQRPWRLLGYRDLMGNASVADRLHPSGHKERRR